MSTQTTSPRDRAGPLRRSIGKPTLLLALTGGLFAALTVAWIEIVAFVFFHGIPYEIGPSKPYWGDGMGDALQWLGFALILVLSASVVGVARSRASDATRPVAA